VDSIVPLDVMDIILGSVIIVVALAISTTLTLTCRHRIAKIARMDGRTVRDILRGLHGP
jgi:hypothetical protein